MASTNDGPETMMQTATKILNCHQAGRLPGIWNLVRDFGTDLVKLVCTIKIIDELLWSEKKFGLVELVFLKVREKIIDKLNQECRQRIEWIKEKIKFGKICEKEYIFLTYLYLFIIN